MERYRVESNPVRYLVWVFIVKDTKREEEETAWTSGRRSKLRGPVLDQWEEEQTAWTSSNANFLKTDGKHFTAYKYSSSDSRRNDGRQLQ
jgi:hypothetical protein